MDPSDIMFVDDACDVFMPDIVMAVGVVFTMAMSLGYRAVFYGDWLKRSTAGLLPEYLWLRSPARTPPGSPNLRAAHSPKRRRSQAPIGSPPKRSKRTGEVSSGLGGPKKLLLQRIPPHRFSRASILDMVKVPGISPVGFSMRGRRQGSGTPAAEVLFANAEECRRVFEAVARPLDLDGIWVSQM